MGEGIHSRLRVVVHITQYSIYYPASTCRSSYLARIKHIERERIVWLVATTISNRSSCLEPQFISCLLRYFRLHTERRNNIGQQCFTETVIAEKKTSRTFLRKVPHHSLTKSANRRIYSSAQTHSDVIARQHNLIYTCKKLGFVFFYPCQFCSSEVTGRIEQMTQTLFFAKTLESLLAIRHSTRIAPYDRRTQRTQFLIHTHQSVHLIRDTYRCHLVCLSPSFLHHLSQSKFHILPPHVGILFCPSATHGDYGCFLFRKKCRSGTHSGISIHK